MSKATKEMEKPVAKSNQTVNPKQRTFKSRALTACAMVGLGLVVYILYLILPSVTGLETLKMVATVYHTMLVIGLISGAVGIVWSIALEVHDRIVRF